LKIVVPRVFPVLGKAIIDETTFTVAVLVFVEL